MKYYINYETKRTLIDENEYTPYLKDRGYKEVSKEQYDAMNAEIEKLMEEKRESENFESEEN